MTATLNPVEVLRYFHIHQQGRRAPQKGCLEVSGDANLIIVEPEKAAPLTQENLHYGLDYSLYGDATSRGGPS